MMGEKGSIHRSGWPSYDASKLTAATFELVVQVNGKVRAKIMVGSDIDEAGAKAMALSDENVKKYLEGKEPKQVRYIAGKLLSIVV
jgi:leucyl-tRNA synthetase